MAAKSANYRLQVALANYERKFGITAPRKEDDDEGGSTGAAIPQHPLLAQSVQHTSDFKRESSVAHDNNDPDVSKKYQLEYVHRLQLQAEKNMDKTMISTPKPM